MFQIFCAIEGPLNEVDKVQWLVKKLKVHQLSDIQNEAI